MKEANCSLEPPKARRQFRGLQGMVRFCTSEFTNSGLMMRPLCEKLKGKENDPFE